MGGVFATPFNRRSLSPLAINSKPGKQILSSEQKLILRQSWSRLRGERGNEKLPISGEEIMSNILKLYPQTKNLFSSSSNNDLTSTPKINTTTMTTNGGDENYAHHARIFVTVLDFTMKNLDDLENDVAPTLLVLGRRHRGCKVYETNNNSNEHFTEEFFDYFLPATLQFVAKFEVKHGPPSVDLMQAWAVLLYYMISKLKLGYHTEAMQKKSCNKKYL